MAWTERFMCDICGKQKADNDAWWLARMGCHDSRDGSPMQPMLKLHPWNNLVAHSAEAKHLCGAACAHKYLDRWMGDLLAGDGLAECAPAKTAK